MLDSAKARMLLGWTPRWTLDQALKMVIGWHSAHQRGESLRPVVQQQIDQYQSAATLH